MKLKTPTPEDLPQIKNLVKKAFEESIYGFNQENEIIEKIHQQKNEPFFELVAIKNNEIIGYGLLSLAFVGNTKGLVLAPLAVSPQYQRQGIGAQIIKGLEEIAKKNKFPFIHILGDPNYYQKFDYLPAKNFNIHPPFEVKDKYFLIKEIFPNTLNAITGKLTYNEAFN